MKLLGLRSFILIFSHAYMEYTHVPWLGKDVYRRSVDLDSVVWC